MTSATVLRSFSALAVALVSLVLVSSAFADDGPGPVGPQGPDDGLYVVQNLGDAGPGSLRAEVADAASDDNVVITFAAGVRGQIGLKSPITVGSRKLTIQGPGAAGLQISGGDSSRVFVVPASGNLRLTNLTVTHGRASAPAVKGEADGQPSEGGAIVNRGSLYLDGVAVTESTALGGYSPGGRGGPAYGGGIYNTGTLTVDDSRLTGNVARGNGTHDETIGTNKRAGGLGAGGAIWNEGSLEVIRSEFSGNSAIGADGESALVFITSVGTEGGSARGGAIMDGERSRRLSIFDSTFAGNAALAGAAGNGEVSQFPGGDAAGGAIFSSSGGLALVQSTVVNNRAELGRFQGRGPRSGVLGAGGLDLRAGGVSLLSDTIAFDSGSADVATASPLPTRSSIVGSCAGARLSSLGYNLDIRGSCGLEGTTDLRNVDPRLGKLADEGGPTRTMPLSPQSPAIDTGLSGEELLDQRGATRPTRISNRALPPGGNASDIGAYELQSTPRLHYDLSPQALSFGQVKVGAVSRYQEATLTNDGDLPFQIGTVTIGGGDQDEFSISSQNCSGIDLPAGAACKVRVRFSPEDGGIRNARVTIAAGAPVGPLEVSLVGNGVEGASDANPSQDADHDPDPADGAGTMAP